MRFQRPASDFELNEQNDVRKNTEDSFGSAADIFDADDDLSDQPLDSVIPTAMEETTRLRPERTEEIPSLGRSRDRAVEPVRQEPTVEESKPKHVYQKYVSPPLSLLRDYAPAANNSEDEMRENIVTITETLAQLKISCEVVGVTPGADGHAL